MTSLLLLAIVCSANPMPTQSEPSFTVDSSTGRLIALDKTWQAKLDDRPPIAFQQLRQTNRSLPSFPTTGVILANGDRIPGTFLGGDDTAIRLKSSLAADGLRFPLPSVRVLWITPMPIDLPLFVDRYPWLDSPQTSDVILLRNGDRRTGDIERFTNDGVVKLRTSGQTVTVMVDTISAIVLNPRLNAVRKIKGAYAHATLADGTRLTLTSATTVDATLRATLASGGTIHVPLGDVYAISMQQGGSVELSSLAPKVAVEPFGEWGWPLGVNRSVKGAPLTLRESQGVSTFRTGLGLHPHMRATYPLAGRYARFESLVGLDGLSGQRGCVKVDVFVDGISQKVNNGQPITVSTGVLSLNVPLTNAKELTLEAAFGNVGDVQADVTFAGARLIEANR